MPLNDITPQSNVRRPRLRVMVANTPMPGGLLLEVVSANNFSGDRFHADFAPPVGLAGPGGLVWWAAQDKIQVVAQMGLIPPGSTEAQTVWTSVLTGIVDQVAVNPVMGTVSIDGRDLAALLRDSGPVALRQNQTSSELVTAIATANGLTPVVTATTTLAGRYYSIDHKIANLSTAHHVANQWDAVVELARLEGFDAFVTGTELHFHPSVAADANPWTIQFSPATQTAAAQGNVIQFNMTRALHIAKGVKVVVQSWNSRQAQVITSTQESVSLSPVETYNFPVSQTSTMTQTTSISGTASAAGTNPQTVTLIRPGLTQQQADNLAQQYLAEYTKHERTISVGCPGDFLLTPRVMVAVQGTGTSFDQTYYPTEITKSMDKQGFTMRFTAKNQSPQVLAAAT